MLIPEGRVGWGTLFTAQAVFSLLEPLLVFTTLQISSLAASSLAMSTVECGLRECLLGWYALAILSTFTYKHDDKISFS